ncbi:MAG: sigma-70 family polymerase sigma factor [Glaciihabitans sp.]|nr:sigma-70 family polymerase sigma factor [Glaciihabitans sp.]
MRNSETGLNTSDETLVANARSGDQGAFAELWRRHYRSGARVARQFTTSIDADDLVSEAYTRIYQRVLAGGGPTGAFRPYLYTTIRNLAASWGAASRDVQVDDIQDFEDPSTLDDPAAIALDRTLTARAFRSLPERWQSVLWYTEVEGMDPHEVAPILGMSANGVAALSYRAREGLRKAWLQAHVSDPGASDACKWTMSRLGESARHSLTARETEKLADHLESCAKCSIVSEEVEEVGSHLALVMLPILLGGVVGGAILSALGHAGTAAAATAASAAIPVVPASFTVLAAPATFAPAVASGLAMGAATSVSALVGSIVVVAAVGGGVALGIGHSNSAQDFARPTMDSSLSQDASGHRAPGSHSGSTSPEVPIGSVLGALSTSSPAGAGGPMDPGSVLFESVSRTLGGVEAGVTDGASKLGDTTKNLVNTARAKVVDPTLGAVTPGASPTGQAAPGGAPVTTSITLGGTGTPGAIVAAQAGGIVYGTAKVGSDGKFALQVDALPRNTVLSLGQHLTVLGIVLPIKIPLTIDTGGLGIAVHLLN